MLGWPVAVASLGGSLYFAENSPLFRSRFISSFEPLQSSGGHSQAMSQQNRQ
jgi:hypothetical protein